MLEMSGCSRFHLGLLQTPRCQHVLLWASLSIKYAGMWRDKSVSDQAMEGGYSESLNGPRSGDALGI